MRSSIPPCRPSRVARNEDERKPTLKRPACELVRAPEEADVVKIDEDAEVQNQHVNAAMSIALNHVRSKDVVGVQIKQQLASLELSGRDSDVRSIDMTDLDKSLCDREDIVGHLLHHIGTCTGIQWHDAKLDLSENAAAHISFTDQLVQEVRAMLKKGDATNNWFVKDWPLTSSVPCGGGGLLRMTDAHMSRCDW